MKHLGTKLTGSEAQKKVGAYIYDDKVTGATSFDMHNIAALTFGETQCQEVFAIIKEGINIDESTPLTIEKSLKLLKHLITHGAERCVDAAWDLADDVEGLESYNTALLRGAVHHIIGGGVDKGEPVRIVANELKELLADDSRIREERKKNADPNALVPLGSKDDFVEPAVLAAQSKQPLKSNTEELGVTFGSAGQSTVIGAAYSLEDMMKKANEQPERYFDDRRRMSGGQGPTKELDSQYTREKLAPDLLDLDFSGGGGGGEQAVAPPVQDLVAKQREEELKRELERKDREMKALVEQQQQMMQQQQAAMGMNPQGMGMMTPQQMMMMQQQQLMMMQQQQAAMGMNPQGMGMMNPQGMGMMNQQGMLNPQGMPNLQQQAMTPQMMMMQQQALQQQMMQQQQQQQKQQQQQQPRGM